MHKFLAAKTAQQARDIYACAHEPKACLEAIAAQPLVSLGTAATCDDSGLPCLAVMLCIADTQQGTTVPYQCLCFCEHACKDE